MGWPVVLVDNGGLPVTESDNGIPMSVAENGRGTPVTIVDSGGIGAKLLGQSLIGIPGNDLPKLPVGAKVAIIGDSILQFNHTANSAGTVMQQNVVGEVNQAFMLKPRFKFATYTNLSDTRPTGTERYFSGANVGVGGDTPAHVKTRLITNGEIWPMKPDILIIAAGVNGLISNTAADYFAILQEMCEAAMARGIRAVLALVRPHGIKPSDGGGNYSAHADGSFNFNGDTDAGFAASWPVGHQVWTEWADLRDRVTAYADPSERAVWLWDTVSSTVDPSPSSGQYGEAKNLYTRDGRHFAARGAYYSGKALNGTLDNLIEDGTIFNADPADAANRFPVPSVNGVLGGVGGTKDTNTDNTTGGPSGETAGIADNWSITRLSPTSNLGAKVTAYKKTVGGLNRQCFKIDITDNTSINVYERWRFGVAGLAQNISRTGLADNSWVRGYMRCEVSAWDYWRCFSTQMIRRNASTATEFTVDACQWGTLQVEPWVDEAAVFWLATPWMKIVSTTVDMRFYISQFACAVNGASGSGTIEFDSPIVLGEQDDPTVLFPSGPI